MALNNSQRQLLRSLPGVDRLLDLAAARPQLVDAPQSVVVRSIRQVLDQMRQRILAAEEIAAIDLDAIMADVQTAVAADLAMNLRRTINATGIIVHTNLGRSLLAETAIENTVAIAGRYSNLEYQLSQGKRGSRYTAVADLICELTGAEDALVVNNNAGAVLLSLDTLAKGREVIVSRGELVEIGGAFRIPDVMAKSGAVLREVGTTNRTHLKDYEDAVSEQTGLLLKVHKSNYAVVGFTKETTVAELAALAQQHSLPVMEDLGSGTLIDFSRYGMIREPTVQDSIAAGASLVTFSGDKLLGGPQAGLLVGNRDIITAIKQNPLTRALRIDKMTLAALEATLRLYRQPEIAIQQIPTLRMLTEPAATTAARAQQLLQDLQQIGDSRLFAEIVASFSRAGGGSLPSQQLPTQCVAVRVNNLPAAALERFMRTHTPAVIGRIENDIFLMDARTLQDEEISIIATAFEHLLQGETA